MKREKHVPGPAVRGAGRLLPLGLRPQQQKNGLQQEKTQLTRRYEILQVLYCQARDAAREKETAEAEHWSRLHAAVEQVQSSLGLTAETASEPAPGQEEPADQPLFLLPREPQETAVPQGQEAPESTEEPPILPNEPSDAPDAAEEAPEADPDDTQEEQAEQEPDGVLPPEEEDVPQG